ncbi:MAG: hypothetical protein HC812_00005, partial [Leptolyngbya sp. RL_3_1]|nr:hypothetical protein [Leptolyngbya sp. RL_3_1]
SDANCLTTTPSGSSLLLLTALPPVPLPSEPFDKGLYDGRENIATRMLDLDVGALASNDWIYGKDGVGVEHNGLVYAYREDAVREDEIVRPVSGTPTGCNTYATLKAYIAGSAGCYMQYNPTSTPPRVPYLQRLEHY